MHFNHNCRLGRRLAENVALLVATFMVVVVVGCGSRSTAKPATSAEASSISSDSAYSAPIRNESEAIDGENPTVQDVIRTERKSGVIADGEQRLAAVPDDFQLAHNGHADSTGTGTWAYLASPEVPIRPANAIALALDPALEPAGYGLSESADGEDTSLRIMSQSPQSLLLVPTVEHNAVVRWTSGADRYIRVFGAFEKVQSHEGDGVEVMVLVAGAPLYRYEIPYGEPVDASFEFTIYIAAGSSVDFVVSHDGPGDANNNAQDDTFLSAIIVSCPESPTSAESEIAARFLARPETRMPATRGEDSVDDDLDSRLVWGRATYLEPYLRSSGRDHKMDELTVEFLEKFVERAVAQPPSVEMDLELVEIGGRVNQARWQNPYIAFAYAQACVWCSLQGDANLQYGGNGYVDAARRAIRNATEKDDLADAPYLGYRASLLRASLDRGHVRFGQLYQERALQRAINFFVEAVSDPEMSKTAREFLLARILHDLQNTCLGGTHYSVVGAMQAAPRADPWLSKMLLALMMIDVGELAEPPDGEAGLVDCGPRDYWLNLRNARELLIEAWSLRPDHVEAVATLVPVAARQFGDDLGGVETPRFWFDQAIAVDFEDPAAYWYYREFLDASNNRRAELLAFARECLETKRFDTSVPRWYDRIILEIDRESERRGSIFGEEGIYEGYEMMLRGYRSEATTDQERNLRDSQLAAVAWLAGRRSTAERLITELGSDMNSAVFVDFGTSLYAANRGIFGAENTLPDGGDQVRLAGWRSPKESDAATTFDPIQEIRFATDRNTLLVTTAYAGCFLWKLADNFRSVEQIQVSESALHLSADISPNGKMLAVAVREHSSNQISDARLWLYEIGTDAPPVRLLSPLAGRTDRIRFSPDGTMLAAANTGGRVLLWNMETNRPFDLGTISHGGIMWSLDFSADGRTLATAGGDSLMIWDMPRNFSEQREPLARRYTKSLPRYARSLHFSPDGSQLLVALDMTDLWDVATREMVWHLNGDRAVFSPDGHRFATAGRNVFGATGAIVWDAETAEQVARLQGGHEGIITALTFLPDGEHLLTGDSHGVIRCWDTGTASLTNEYGQLPVFAEESAAESTPTLRPTMTNSLGMEFVRIEAGEFVMGSPEDELERSPNETPHRVRISRPFYMARFEVTQDEYGVVTGTHPSDLSPSGRKRGWLKGNPYTGHFPVSNVTWERANEFCRQLSMLPDEQQAGRTYRLPTEAEWEYACRGGSTTVFGLGDSLSADQANFKATDPYGDGQPGVPWQRPRAVGSYQPNQFGLYDMHGNVWEWCQDWYAPYDQQSAVEDPKGPPNGTEKVIRGGCFYTEAHKGRSARRNHVPTSQNVSNLGLRVVCEINE